MKAFRIGRKPTGPWTNRTPPIRGGTYHQRLDTPDTSETFELQVDAEKGAINNRPTNVVPVDGISPSLLTPGPPSVDDKDATIGQGTALCPKRCTPRGSPSRRDDFKGDVKCEAFVSTVEVPAANAQRGRAGLTPEEYTDWAVQQGKYLDIRDYPSLEPCVQEKIVEKYRALHQQIQDEGLYDCPYLQYGKEIARYLTLFGLFLLFLSWSWYLTSACFLGLFWVCSAALSCSLTTLHANLVQHQLMFTAHDAGHRAITGVFVYDTLIGMFIADFCCGLSIGWWKSSHNVHHLITNQPVGPPT